GRAFIRLIGASTATHTFRVYSFQHNAVTTANALTTGTLSFSSVTDTSFAVTATYTNDTNSNSSCTIQYRLAGTEAWTSASVTTDRTNRRFNGTITGLSQGTTYEVQVTYADPDGVVGTNPLFGSVTTALNGVTSGSLSLVATATTIDVTLTYTNDANNNSSASVQIRTLPNGTFGTSQPMSVNRANKTFSYQFTGLANDTSYEIRATYSDPDGVFGPNPLVGSIVTLGKSVQPQSIIVTPSATAATVTVTYQYDNNANSTLGLQYRSIHHAIWTTVNSSSLTVNRGSKRFTATLTQLRPNTTYEVEATFSDPLVDCRECRTRSRADHLQDGKCPNCGSTNLTEPRNFNLMFKTHVGPVESDENIAYLRPETAQGIFVNFNNVQQTMRRKLPFGIAQVGKSFRNEITPGNFTFRTREFEQMEIEYFCKPPQFLQPGEKNDEELHAEWIEQRFNWYVKLGLPVEKLQKRAQTKEELAHYAKATTDIEYRFPGSAT
ncbi:MAG: hypothetical protein C4321_11215, partial [Chloroflexota bacterium]